jgi:hypothetical protein
MTLKWKPNPNALDPEMKAQIQGLLYKHGIDRPQIGLTHTELNALSAADYIEEYPEDEEPYLEMFQRDEKEKLYPNLIKRQRQHYTDCGGMVDTGSPAGKEWRWYAKAPVKVERPMDPEVARIVEAVKSTVMTVTETEAADKTREADPAWREAVRQRRIAEGYEGYINPGTE